MGSEKVSGGGRKVFPGGCGKSFRGVSEGLSESVVSSLRCSRKDFTKGPEVLYEGGGSTLRGSRKESTTTTVLVF